MAKTSKCELESMELQKIFVSRLRDDGSEVAAHQILGKLVDKLRGVSELGVICDGDDTPVLRAAVNSGSLAAGCSGFETLKLASIKKRGTLVAGERSIPLWKLSELYHSSPIVFKSDSGMTLEEYAFWMRRPVAEIEKIFCREVINDLMKFVKHDPMWRVWNGIDWLEIDPWKFAIEVDLASEWMKREEHDLQQTVSRC